MGRKKIDMTSTQRRRLFSIAKDLGFHGGEAIEFLREQTEQWTGKRSLRTLSKRQADEMIVKLQQPAGQAPAGKRAVSPGRLSENQLRLIRDLAGQAFSFESQFRVWLKNYHKVDHEEWLTPLLAGKVIEGLKNMAKRRNDNDGNEPHANGSV